MMSNRIKKSVSQRNHNEYWQLFIYYVLEFVFSRPAPLRKTLKFKVKRRPDLRITHKSGFHSR